jgi:type II secretory pathway pseudopilin PulG
MSKERFIERQAEVRNAVARLQEAVVQPESPIVRDAVIQRFEFSFELVWKTLKLHLERQGHECGGPRVVATTAPKPNRAFALIELLVVIASIALLASLVLPALGRGKARARSIRCLNHLKQLGLATLIYAQENREKVQIHFPGEPDKPWGSALSTNQNLTASNLFVCPSYAPKEFKDWRCIYGVRLDPPTDAANGQFDETLLVEEVHRPADYVHLTDTTSRGRAVSRRNSFFISGW